MSAPGVFTNCQASLASLDRRYQDLCAQMADAAALGRHRRHVAALAESLLAQDEESD